ncbi:MAG: hypothetical protein K2X66_05835, partial [Cyanobacteria bacterium]|nr:hypothetical protein [Cyanobacteriota bacterium]
NGKSISFFAPKLPEVVDTIGGNGVSKRAAYIIKQLAEELNKNGEISATEYQDLLNLSRLGFSMADIQSILEQNIPVGTNSFNGTDKMNFMNNTLVTLPDGSKKYFTEIASAISTGQLGNNAGLDQALRQNYQIEIDRSINYTDPELTKRPITQFTQLLNKIQNSSSFQDKPILKDLVINTLSKEIFNSTSVTTNVMDKQMIKDHLIPITEQNSQALCNLSNTGSCEH